MRAQFETLLAKLEGELRDETIAVEQLLRECASAKTPPAKDYWHKKVSLEKQVRALRETLETTK